LYIYIIRGERVERNSLGFQLKDGGAAPPLRSNSNASIDNTPLAWLDRVSIFI